MSASRSVENHIIRQLLERRSGRKRRPRVEWLITLVSSVAGIGLLAAFAPGLLWVILLGALVLTLGA